MGYEAIIPMPTYPNEGFFPGSSAVCAGGSTQRPEAGPQARWGRAERAGWQPAVPGIHFIPSKAGYIKSNNSNNNQTTAKNANPSEKGYKLKHDLKSETCSQRLRSVFYQENNFQAARVESNLRASTFTTSIQLSH